MLTMDRYGAELLNVALGIGAELLLPFLYLAGVIAGDTWGEWALLSLSFVVLPFLLIGARRLSPALDRSFAVLPRPPLEATGVAAKQPLTPSSD